MAQHTATTTETDVTPTVVVRSAVEGATPQHTHDCARCTFLGTRYAADLYHCLYFGTLPSVIARWSSDGPDYSTDVAFASTNPALVAARDLAVQRGLVLATRQS